ncbi:MAG: DUF2442 domain-containing protein [Synergistaceae bacterium]|jgi:hypothetical protein|nr:DUF2442 domain-containing protein [Synergistaceae bacterium]
MAFIRSIVPLNDWRLFVEMETGSVVVVDVSRKLDTARYGDLRDRELFRSVVTDGDVISWDHGRVTVTARELMDVVFCDVDSLTNE